MAQRGGIDDEIALQSSAALGPVGSGGLCSTDPGGPAGGRFAPSEPVRPVDWAEPMPGADLHPAGDPFRLRHRKKALIFPFVPAII